MPGTTAHQALVRCGLVLGAAALLVVAAMALGPENGGQATAPGIALILGATTVGIVVTATAVRRFRSVLLAELAAGYVTTTFHQGMFWMVNRPGPKAGNDVVGWVWDGVWVLTSEGVVVSGPDLDLDPPGMYPSPHRPGQLELWTGSQWSGVHAEHPTEPG